MQIPVRGAGGMRIPPRGAGGGAGAAGEAGGRRAGDSWLPNGGGSSPRPPAPRSPRHMGRGSGSSELAMAAAPARCPDCPGPEPGGGGGVLSVPHLGIAVDEGDVLPGALRIVRQLRPSWEPATVKTKVWGGPCAGPPRNGGRE